MVSVFLSLYFGGLVSFLFFSHPLYCSLLLVFKAMVCCGLLVCLLGFSWYVLLFGLVYVGGVYILFMFVSVCGPNLGVVVKGKGLHYLFMVMLMLIVVWVFVSSEVNMVISDKSDMVCSYSEGYLFCFFCFLLLFGLVFVSLVSKMKDSFYR